MEIRTLDAIAIGDSSRVSEARRTAAKAAQRLGFSEAEAGKVAIAATEAATNVVKHAGEGKLLVNIERDGDSAAVVLLAIDNGAGISNVVEALRDGYSTAGSPGTGLGAMQRLATRFEMYSRPGAGTAVLARFERPGYKIAKREPPLRVGGLFVATAGEENCGDAIAILRQSACTRLLVVDGLGHGLHAYEAAQAAVAAFHANPGGTLEDVLTAMHMACRPTRGAVAALAEIDPGASRVRYAGAGNISAAIVGLERDYNLVSHNGTLGHELRKVQEFSYP
ncbi:MAG TPA: anti-sigma regulatory factor, partial [Bryobacteraceae bacterium]|nr:anti-sigma regulatory factor [Bryobacteraceae bacterium]